IPGKPVKDAPASADAAVEAVEDEAYVFSLEELPFSDPADVPYAACRTELAAIRILSLPQNGTLYLGEDAIEAADLEGDFFVSAADIASGRLRYVPDANGNGEGHASFQFQVRDDGGTAHGGENLSAVHTLTIDVAPVSDAPEATGGAVALDEDGSHAFSAADFGFTDVDGDDLAAVIITSLPGNGRLAYDGEDLTSDDLADGG